jgi:hypothetical protein
MFTKTKFGPTNSQPKFQLVLAMKGPKRGQTFKGGVEKFADL